MIFEIHLVSILCIGHFVVHQYTDYLDPLEARGATKCVDVPKYNRLLFQVVSLNVLRQSLNISLAFVSRSRSRGSWRMSNTVKKDSAVDYAVVYFRVKKITQ